MFIPYNSDVVPTEEGIASLVSGGFCSAESASAMRACMAVQEKLPAGYVVMGQADGPWVTVTMPWDGQKVDTDLTSNLASAVAPLPVRGCSFSDGSFYWSVEAPTAETWAKKSDPGKPSETMKVGPTPARPAADKPA